MFYLEADNIFAGFFQAERKSSNWQSFLHDVIHYMDSGNLKTLLIIAGWFAANVTTVILNKHIFQNLGWMFPVSLTIVHMVTCMIGSILVLKVFRVTPFVSLPWNEWLKGVLPLRYVSIEKVDFLGLFRFVWCSNTDQHVVTVLYSVLILFWATYLCATSQYPSCKQSNRRCRFSRSCWKRFG